MPFQKKTLTSKLPPTARLPAAIKRDKLRQANLTRSTRERFVEEYLLDLDPQQAASRVGLDPALGKRLLGNPGVQRDITNAKRSRATRAEIYADEVLRRWWLLATADARDLIELRRVACRHCHGIDHRYQYTPDELRRAEQEHLVRQLTLPERHRREFDEQGGDGYKGTVPPSSTCPECFGEGVPSVYIHDTRTLSPRAAALYDGVKLHKDGTLELNLRSRDAALNKVADHLGMITQKHAHVVFDPTKLTDEQLSDALASFRNLLPEGGNSDVFQIEAATGADLEAAANMEDVTTDDPP
jgi:hypothetical protein